MRTESVESLLLKLAPDLVTPDLVAGVARIANRPIDFANWKASAGVIGDAFVTCVDRDAVLLLGVVQYGVGGQAVIATVTVALPPEDIVLDGVVSGSRHASKSETVIVRTPSARAFPATVDTLRDTLDIVSAELSAKLSAEL